MKGPAYLAVINRFEKAVREDEFKGAMPPEDHAHIENDLRQARNALIKMFDNLLNKIKEQEQ